MKLDASSALKGITFGRPRVILKTRQFIGLSVCLWIQEGTTWNSQVTPKRWWFSGLPKYPEVATLCNSSWVESQSLEHNSMPSSDWQNPRGSAGCELSDQLDTSKHSKSLTFLHRSDTSFELQQLQTQWSEVITPPSPLPLFVCVFSQLVLFRPKSYFIGWSPRPQPPPPVSLKVIPRWC